MSWSFDMVGTKQGVEDAVREAKPSMDVDRITMELAKEIIIGEIRKVTSNGVHVEASGHASCWNRMNVYGVYLHGVPQ